MIPLFNILVYAQIPAWIILYHFGPRKLNYFHGPFYYSWSGFLLFFIFMGLSGIDAINQYAIHLILFYGLLILVAYHVVGKNGWPWNERIALTFMIVFFFSFFWELPIHILGLIQNGLTSRFVIQASRIIPLYLFNVIWKIRDRKNLINWILIAQIITTGILFMEMSGWVKALYWTYLIRIANFVILLHILFSNKVLEFRERED